ncbi:hypothetical protein FRC14_003467 [Serendipita sp. 396]|nr:hypothetical protein FRC14_003467 [Serendipita sp. 396]
MFLQLPPEVQLLVLAQLPVFSVHRFRLIARECNDIFQSNVSTIYRNIAIYHRIAPDNMNISEIIRGRKVYFDWLDRRLSGEDHDEEAMSWKEYVQRFFLLEKNWINGKALHTVRLTGAQRRHRIQIDEVEGSAISTFGLGNVIETLSKTSSVNHVNIGGIASNCFDTGEPLWTNPIVSPWAHCEFDKGFLIWGRRTTKIEVWRRKCDQEADPLPAYDPDEYQRATHTLLTQLEGLEENTQIERSDQRGKFQPFICLNTEVPTSASRFVYPHLVLATRDALFVFVYDVPNAKLLRKIELDQDNVLDGDGDDEDETVNYVEHSPTHVFVCMERQIGIYKKSDGKADLVFRTTHPPDYLLSIDPEDPEFEDEEEVTLTSMELPLRPIENHTIRLNNFAHSGLREFKAVHVSPCGRIWVAICEESLVYIVTGGLEGTNFPLELTEIYLGEEELYYLAFDGYHVAVAGDRGIYTLSLGRLHEPTDDLHLIHESIQKGSLRLFRPQKDVDMQQTTCLQITDDSVWHVAAVESKSLPFLRCLLMMVTVFIAGNLTGLTRIDYGKRLGSDQEETGHLSV